jgi:hypothetical protein
LSVGVDSVTLAACSSNATGCQRTAVHLIVK